MTASGRKRKSLIEPSNIASKAPISELEGRPELNIYPITPCEITLERNKKYSRREIATMAFKEMVESGYVKEAHAFCSMASTAKPVYTTPDGEAVDEFEGILGMFISVKVVYEGNCTYKLALEPLPLMMARVQRKALISHVVKPQPEALFDDTAIAEDTMPE